MNYIRKEYEIKESKEKDELYKERIRTMLEKDELCKERIRIMVKKNESKINFVRKTKDEPYQNKRKEKD